MFYSTDVLTSRKYGVATVWLVATLGSKSTLRKVSRKAILDVDVRKACETIENPDAPMALRLQSNLLYGVTRVYSQQCGYALSDAEAVKNDMRAVFCVWQKAGLEPEGGNQGRADQIVLQDDPNFLLDLDIVPIDLEAPNMNFNPNDETQMSLTPGDHKSRLSNVSPRSIGGLDLPLSQSSSAGGAVGNNDLFNTRGDSGHGTGVRAAPQLLDDDDLGLEIGGIPPRQPRAPQGKSYPTDPASGAAYDAAPDQPMLDNNDNDVAFNNHDDSNFEGDLRADPQAVDNNEHHIQETFDSNTAMAAAKKRKPRTKKTIPFDKDTTISNSVIAGWSRNYIQTMRQEAQKVDGARLNAIAKKNAAHWMLNVGIFLSQGSRGPLDMFSGAALIEVFTGTNLLNGRKRPLSDSEATNSSPKRSRTNGPSSDDAGQVGVPYDNDIQMNYEDKQYDIEQGREAPTPLEDRQHSSIFPWNQSGGGGGASQGSRGIGSRGLNSGSLNIVPSRRGSRLTSASPLIGRGIDPLAGDIELDVDQTDFQLENAAMTGEDEFELYGAAAQVDTQTAAHSQWQRAALTGESRNFLEFVKNATTEQGEGREDGLRGEDIAFAALLPPKENSCIVAAQGFLHVLTLGSMSAIEVTQEKHWEDIRLKISAAGDEAMI